MHLNESPFALTQDVLGAEVGSTTVGALAINGIVLVGVAALAVYGVRKMVQGALGKKE